MPRFRDQEPNESGKTDTENPATTPQASPRPPPGKSVLVRTILRTGLGGLVLTFRYFTGSCVEPKIRYVTAIIHIHWSAGRCKLQLKTVPVFRYKGFLIQF